MVVVRRVHTFSLGRVIWGLLIGTVIVAGLLTAYVASQRSTEQRSKAAEESAVYERWEFDNAGGWEGSALGAFRVFGGLLNATMTNESGKIYNNAVATTLPQGTKSLSLRVAVGSGIRQRIVLNTPPSRVKTGTVDVINDTAARAAITDSKIQQGLVRPVINSSSCIPKPTCLQGEACPRVALQPVGGEWCTPTPVVTPKGIPCKVPPRCTSSVCPKYIQQEGWCPTTRPFTFLTYYRLAGKTGFEKPLILTGIADGRFYDYSLKFPAESMFQSMTIDQIVIYLLKGVDEGNSVQIDWIRLEGTPTKPPITPSPSSCTGKQDGAPCPFSSILCPTCPPGRFCPQCLSRKGICINGICRLGPQPSGGPILTSSPTPTPPVTQVCGLAGTKCGAVGYSSCCPGTFCSTSSSTCVAISTPPPSTPIPVQKVSTPTPTPQVIFMQNTPTPPPAQ